MNYTCPLCSIDPSSHSLTKIEETDSKIFFYSCPAQAKLYFDSNGIINHYNGILSEMPKNKKWIWIFDSKDFNFNHFIQFNVGFELAKLITSKFSDNLLKIIIINPTIYINFTYKSIKMFLSDDVNNKITFEYNYENIDSIINKFI
jgi:hypothetical protein